MKSIYKLLVIIALSVTIIACNTTKKAKIEDFTVSMDSLQIPIGEVEIQFETIMGLGSLKKNNVSVSYFPKEDVVCLKYNYEYNTFHLFWNRRGRLYFINALQKYNEDYNARNLDKNNNKSRRKYGIIRGYLVWQMFSFTIQAHGNMNVELGYAFKDKSPYFTVFQRTAEYLSDRSRDSNRSSPTLTMYFTRAQATELSAIFEKYVLQGETLDDYQESNIPANETNPNKDVY